MRSAALYLLLLTACHIPTTGALEQYYDLPGLEEIQPDSLHVQQYDEMLACASPPDTVPFGRIRWYRADYIEVRATGRPKAGLAVPSTSSIYLSWLWERDARVIGHEILHLLLPDAVHATPAFAACDPIQESTR